MTNIPENIAVTIERFTVFADDYDRHRPSPPQVLAHLLTQIARCPLPELIVHRGCGTGFSGRYWSDKARQVSGIEPSADMCRTAQEGSVAAN